YTRLTSYWIDADFPEQDRLGSLFVRFVNRCLVPVLGKKVAHIWLSSIVSNRLKIYPYFIFHYVVNKLYFEDRQFRAEWDRVPKHSADGPHALKRLLESRHDGCAIHDALSKRELPPLFKLSWRNDRALSVLRELQANALLSG
ncbi:MAG: capsular polysaccharide synthesis protein, partial [Gammaproteobacteria bacterium]|nr:capsular polysaccharide synthesis protein [Gammaproteobacteria bacterium]